MLSGPLWDYSLPTRIVRGPSPGGLHHALDGHPGAPLRLGPTGRCARHEAELDLPAPPAHNHAPGIVECPDGDLLVSWYRGSGERSRRMTWRSSGRGRRGEYRLGRAFLMADRPDFPDCNTAMMMGKSAYVRGFCHSSRDYLLRHCVTVAAVLALLVGSGVAPSRRTNTPPTSRRRSRRVRLGGGRTAAPADPGRVGPDRTKLPPGAHEARRRRRVPALIEELESGNHLFSWNAALILGELRDPRALDPLGRVASEQSRGDPLAASLALGRFDDPAALDPLVVQLLSGRSRESRRAAAFALGRLQPARRRRRSSSRSRARRSSRSTSPPRSSRSA